MCDQKKTEHAQAEVKGAPGSAQSRGCSSCPCEPQRCLPLAALAVAGIAVALALRARKRRRGGDGDEARPAGCCA